MSQNIYDNPEFFEGYAQLPRSQRGLAGAPEWAAVRRMLPDLAGKRIADLGCGYGWFCRYAREAGAATVLGIDLSEKMLSRAQELTQDTGISWQQGNLENLKLPRNSFDLIYSSLALHYLPEISPLLQTVYEALCPGGCFILTTEHPIYTCTTRQEWMQDAAGQRFWPVRAYQAEGQRSTNWLANGVLKYHRTLGTTFNALIAAGFSLQHVEEWGPSAEQIAADASLAEEADRPMLLLLAARK